MEFTEYFKLCKDMPENFTIDEGICREVLALNLTPEAVKEELLRRGINTEQITGYQDEMKQIRNAKRRSTGFVCMAAGAFLGFLSCVLTITHALPHLFDFVFYGLTTLAVCIVVVGLYYVFE
jgi:hypothetical protein